MDDGSVEISLQQQVIYVIHLYQLYIVQYNIGSISYIYIYIAGTYVQNMWFVSNALTIVYIYNIYKITILFLFLDIGIQYETWL